MLRLARKIHTHMKNQSLFRSIFILALILIISPAFGPGQEPDYEKMWKEIEVVRDKGLPRSALDLLDVLYKKAVGENNQPQLLKSVLFRINLSREITEDHLIETIRQTESQLPLLQSPAREVMHSVLAELYWFYYQQNRYVLLNRTPIDSNASADIAEWDVKQLRQVITAHYRASLAQQELLQGIALKDFEPILELPKQQSYLIQPTLYDFLAHRAIDFFRANDAGLTQKAMAVQRPDKNNSARMFAPLRDFIRDSIVNCDAADATVLNLFRKLMYVHLSKGNTIALVHADLDRLAFALEVAGSGNENKALYLNSLKWLQEGNQHDSISAEIAYRRAAYLTEQPYSQMVGADSEARYNLRHAHTICTEAIKAFPQSSGAANCRLVLNQIEDASLETTIQQVELPGKNIPVLLQYRNITRPGFRLISIGPDSLESIMDMDRQDEKVRAFLSLPALASWTIDLPFEDDYRSHSTVIDLQALTPGLYVLLAASSDRFDTKEMIEYSTFQVSTLSFISRKNDGVNRFYLLDRETGKGIANATILVKSREYDYRRRKSFTEQKLQLKTGRDGSFNIGAQANLPENRSFYIEAYTKTDRLFSDRYFDTHHYKPQPTKSMKTWFFTDRAIYRPGQVVYFKGITLESEAHSNAVINKQETQVRFLDVNYQEIGSLNCTTNEYGSFEGSFTIPSQLLTGNMRITNENGSVDIAVEEYKRPTFEVVMNAPEQQFRLNEKVSISGNAMAYAGYPLDSVDFTYRVLRQKYYPYWRFWWGMPPYGGEQQLVASGESSTRKDGSFNIVFIALPDQETPAFYDPVYTYDIIVDVADKTGESHTGNLAVEIGTKALLLRTNLQGKTERGAFKGLSITASNLMNMAVTTEASIQVTRLAQPERLLRPALWPTPDRHYLSKAQFVQRFPNDVYADELEPEKRKQTEVFNQLVTISDSLTPFANGAVNWPEGEYLLEVKAKDAFGQEVNLKQVFTLYDSISKAMPVSDLGWFAVSAEEAQPGQTIEYQVGTAAKNCQVLTEVFVNGELTESKWIKLDAERKKVPFTVVESQRGMIRFQQSYVTMNRIVQQSAVVKVPYTNKMLDVTLETKRGTLVPGSTEQWELRIRGKQQEIVAAELLAAMYDASLDQFRANNWDFDLLVYDNTYHAWTGDEGFTGVQSARLTSVPYLDQSVSNIDPPRLNWFGYNPFGYFRGSRVMAGPGMKQKGHALEDANDMVFALVSDEVVVADSEEEESTLMPAAKHEKPLPSLRTNFSETAFFYPQLRTDADGSVLISFKLPDALTRWKLMLLAHSQDLKTGTKEYTFTAAKAFMIVPNISRFYREGDTAWVSAKVVNTGKEDLTGIARVEIRDALSMQFVDCVTESQKPVISLAPGQSREISWKMVVGKSAELLAMRFIASANSFTDSEERFVPVLSSRVLVTETMPLRVGPHKTANVTLQGLAVGKAKDARQLVVDFTSNPVWYAVQALPYLAAEATENADNVFNRFYANSLSAHIANSMPEVMRVVESWKSLSPDAFLSNLEKNQDMKSILISETPWVLASKDETMQKRNIALLFDLNNMRYDQQQARRKLAELQLPSGAWTWFAGMPENRYITQQIVIGFGHLNHLGVNLENDNQMREMMLRAVQYLDEVSTEDYEKMKRTDGLKHYSINPVHLNYLYARSFFKEIPIPDAAKPAFSFYLDHTGSDWLGLNNSLQAMAALVLSRNGEDKLSDGILASLLERSLMNEETGRYWKQPNGYYWYEAPIEGQAMLIEAFEAIRGNVEAVDEMRSWLLSQKQTNHWPTGRATAEAIYALLLRGTSWITDTGTTEVMVGGRILRPEKTEAGSGYFSQRWTGKEIEPALAEVSLNNSSDHTAWGGMYWQYVEEMDKVRSSETPLKLSRQLFVEKIIDGEVNLVPINRQQLKIGDKVKVRLVLEVDRDMEFVHLKDYRAAAFEPVNVLSGYRYAGGLGFYEATRDAWTDFFICDLSRGKYVFEYTLVATQTGDFNAGFANIQCLYAPEFSAHTAGMRITVVK